MCKQSSCSLAGYHILNLKDECEISVQRITNRLVFGIWHKLDFMLRTVGFIYAGCLQREMQITNKSGRLLIRAILLTHEQRLTLFLVIDVGCCLGASNSASFFLLLSGIKSVNNIMEEKFILVLPGLVYFSVERHVKLINQNLSILFSLQAI